MLDRIVAALQQAHILRLRIEAISLDSTDIKVHPDGAGALKNGKQSIGKFSGGWTTKLHLAGADARTGILVIAWRSS